MQCVTLGMLNHKEKYKIFQMKFLDWARGAECFYQIWFSCSKLLNPVRKTIFKSVVHILPSYYAHPSNQRSPSIPTNQSQLIVKRFNLSFPNRKVSKYLKFLAFPIFLNGFMNTTRLKMIFISQQCQKGAWVKTNILYVRKSDKITTFERFLRQSSFHKNN